jgi:hypothetical protein
MKEVWWSGAWMVVGIRNVALATLGIPFFQMKAWTLFYPPESGFPFWGNASMVP